MAIVSAMEKRKLPKPAQIRTSPEIQNRFKVAVQRLALSRVARINDKPPTMEATTAALWLWFSRLSPEEAEAFLAREYPEVERLMDADEPQGEAGAVERRVNPKARPRKSGG